MKKRSIRLKITLWFSVILLVITGMMTLAILSISSGVMQKNIQDNLIAIVEDNVDEIEYFQWIQDASPDGDGDDYLAYGDGFLEIDDDFLDLVGSNYTALYQEDGTFLYGENPIAAQTASLSFQDNTVQTTSIDGEKFYMYDRMLTQEGLEGLWLRGIVSAESGTRQINSILHISLTFLPILVIIAIVGGYWFAGRILRPIQKISVATTQIEQGNDLKNRIELGEGEDELHQLADAINAMIDRLDRSFETEKRFVSDASHELRTPVSVISAQCEYSLEKPRSKEEYIQALTVIRRQSKKVGNMITQMLEFTRLEMKSDRYHKAPFNFSELIAMTCLDFQYIHEKNIQLENHIEPDVILFGNYELIQRLANNLISNAYRYGKEDGHIIVTVQQKDANIYFSVTDDGIGIAPEEQEKIFERFYQVERSRTGEGSGLGLSLAKEIVLFHKGTLTVESTLNQGSRFVAAFPVQQ